MLFNEAQFNEAQRKHMAFRQKWVVPVTIGSIWLPSHVGNLPGIPLPNGKQLPAAFLACFIGPAVLWGILALVGRLIFGEEGRLNLKKVKTEHRT